jgi:hypothetical protein
MSTVSRTFAVSTRIDDGPVDQGASWHNVSKIFGVTKQ